MFDQIKDGKAPEGKWPLTLASHPGKAIIREPGLKNKRDDGEQLFFGDAKDATVVTYEGKYIHMVNESKFWLEIPRNQHEEDYAMWFRTLHSRNDDYFAWIINENGTISSKNNEDLVLGFGIA